LRQRSFAHHHLGPDRAHQLVLAHHLADAAAEHEQDVERLLAQAGQLTLCVEQLAGRQIERATAQRQAVCFWHLGRAGRYHDTVWLGTFRLSQEVLPSRKLRN
jgi:hypothetical protein